MLNSCCSTLSLRQGEFDFSAEDFATAKLKQGNLDTPASFVVNNGERQGRVAHVVGIRLFPGGLFSVSHPRVVPSQLVSFVTVAKYRSHHAALDVVANSKGIFERALPSRILCCS